MQPFPNPYYYNHLQNYQQGYNQPTPNPYMDKLPQLQAQQMQNFTPLGKIVESIDIVKSTDIPMDGNMYYFPKADGSMIFGKQWLTNGTTQITSFKPFLDEEPNNSAPTEEKCKFDLSDEATEVFMKQFDSIIERIDKLEKSLKTNPRKKEVASDE